MKKSHEYYRQRYLDYHGKPEQIAKRGARVQARRDMIKKVGKEAVKGKDVGHLTPLRKKFDSHSNDLSNLAIQSTRQRGYKAGRKGT